MGGALHHSFEIVIGDIAAGREKYFIGSVVTAENTRINHQGVRPSATIYGRISAVPPTLEVDNVIPGSGVDGPDVGVG